MTPGWRIVKMSGAGNDFVVVGAEVATRIGADLPAWTRQVCLRGLSVGADGVLVVTRVAEGRVRVVFLNPDGGEAFCGNGSRCAARYASLRGLAPQEMILETLAGEIPAHVRQEMVRLDLPFPEDRGPLDLVLGEARITGRCISAGAPHFVAFVESVESAPLADWGPRIRHHPAFGIQGTNVDLIGWRDDGSLSIRTWERGVEAETLACGSGAVAAAVVARGTGARGAVRVLPKSGVALRVDPVGSGEPPPRLALLGDARWVFEAEVSEEAIRRAPSC